MPLRLLYKSDDKAGEVARVDIIAVHGLNPRSIPDTDHAWDTWRKPSGEKGRLWLRDDLPKYAPYARIFLYQYNSKLVYGGDKARFIDKANDLLEALRIERKKDEKRPLIFMAHSLGGILIRQALVNAHNNPKYNMIHTSTTGLAFFGTPHEGGDERLVALGAVAARIASVLQVQPSNDLIETLKKGSLFSDVLAEQWRHHLESYQLVSFWEGIGDIVPKKSATFGLSGSRENVVRLESTHSDLCRFDEHDEDNSKLVLNNIEDLYEHAISTSYSFDVREALQWVSRIPYEQHHNTNKSDILQGTGLWLFKKKIFTEWKRDERSTILWLHGMPGCGKTKLVSRVVEKQRAALDKRQGLAFFYCNRNDAERERANPEDILRSIVRQLSMSGPHARLSEFVAAKYTERKCKHFVDGPLRLDECVDLIIKLTEQYTCATIIIDALDECDVTTRHSLLAALSSIMQYGSSTKIFVSSRDDKDITLKLQGLPNLYIKASNNAKDIDRYVHFKVEQALADRRLLDGNVSAETAQRISDTLTRKAQGMFLWVTLQLQNLCSLRLNVEEDLFKELGRLPEDLADTYTQIFEHVRKLGPQSHVIAERSLKWLLCQARDLSEAEFLAAVSIGTERLSVNLTKEKVLFICGNLVIFDHELKVFRFAHLSVREYLETQSNFTLGTAHALGAEISLLVCLRRYTDLAAQYARKFRRYAFLYWLYHCREARKSGLSGPIHQLLEDFLHIREGTNLFYAAWTRSMHSLRQRSGGHSQSVHESIDGTGDEVRWQAIDIRGYRRISKGGSAYLIPDSLLGDQDCPYDPTFVACFLDLPEIVEQNLLAKKVGDIVSNNIDVFGRRNLDGETYLHVACHSGSSKLLRLLLQYPIPVRAEDLLRMTALHYAVHPHVLLSSQSARWTETVRSAYDPADAAERVAMIGLLIEKGSIVDAADKDGRTALHLASNANFFTEVQCLLEHGAFVDARTHKGQIPLHLAAELGHTTVARVLLHFNADTEARASDGRTPLLLTVGSGYTAITQLLLQSKADTEARNSNRETPLLLAARLGHTAITQLLLQSKADTEAKNSNREIPLLLAARLGHTVITQLLLQSKADTEAKNSNGMTPLLLAVRSGYTANTQLLLQSKADTEAKNSNGMTPLLLAVRSGYTVNTQLLLQSKADTEAKNSNGMTPLLLVVRSGYTANTQLLLQSKADTEARASDGRTPLLLAVRSGYTANTQLLLQSKADTEARNSDRETPLLLAARLGDTTIAQLLLQYNTDIEARGWGEKTPLLQAAESGHTAITQLLLQSKADIEARDGCGRTPLFWTAMRGDIDIGRLLLRLGADINAKDSRDLTSLAQSLLMRHEAMAQVLIDESANIKEVDLADNTVLHYAAGSRLKAMISRLLQMGAHTNGANIHGATPLHVAIDPHCTFPKIRYGGDKAFPIVQLLVDAGADVEISNHSGRTPLHLVAEMADKASVRLLLERGANIKAMDGKGLLPLDHAAVSGSLQVFSFLFRRWYDVMAESSECAVETWLRQAAKPVNEFDEVNFELPLWRTMSIEDLVEFTTPSSKFQKMWAERGIEGFSTWYRARLIVREMRARREAQTVNKPCIVPGVKRGRSVSPPSSSNPLPNIGLPTLRPARFVSSTSAGKRRRIQHPSTFEQSDNHKKNHNHYLSQQSLSPPPPS